MTIDISANHARAKRSLFVASALSAAVFAFAAQAQAPGPMGLTPIPVHKAKGELPLYPGAAPGSENATQVEAWAKAPGDLVARNVTHPTITPYLPTAKATGAAVVVMPGGGNVVLSMGREGYDVATYLAAHGIAAFVVKYRVNETPADIGKMPPMGAPRGAGGPPPGAPPAGAARGAGGPPPGAAPAPSAFGVADGQAALRWVRAHAKQYAIDPKRVGMVGFSAGAFNTMGIAVANDPTARADFVAPIYGGFAHQNVPANPAPLFLAQSSDDPLMGGGVGFPIYDDWKKAGGKVEMHIYENGGHGFGASKKGTTSDGFLDEFLLWIKVNGFLKAGK